MIFTQTNIGGACIVEPEKHEDHRGFFARSWDIDDFHAHGLTTKVVQCSISLNHKKGTVRGMHYQIAPFEEVKIVRCTRGAIYDVIIDMRPGSKTFMKWLAVELTADNYKMFYIPEGCAHGFQTLADHSEVLYQISEQYSPDHARALRWNDPQFHIDWPEQVTVISERDRTCADYQMPDARR
jgi:dTDP-4-dehydrorhamnose 3,5-epimerase